MRGRSANVKPVTSKVVFKLKAVPGGTRLSFTYAGVPKEHYAAIKQGWIDYYSRPMKALLG